MVKNLKHKWLVQQHKALKLKAQSIQANIIDTKEDISCLLRNLCMIQALDLSTALFEYRKELRKVNQEIKIVRQLIKDHSDKPKEY